jgi:hypothetical protein
MSALMNSGSLRNPFSSNELATGRDPEFAILDKLITTGLGSISQAIITKEEHDRAMRGEIVRVEREYTITADPLTMEEKSAARRQGQIARRAREVKQSKRGPTTRRVRIS